ncbi:Serine/threonine-protein kinase haspin [Holothuria leucospilota]|uniref:non-specific serine/threonine protein kinase n=1 Tax=Holothuria leucospilota TaxID=206669 RepID=A0A9Q1BGI5_HOLLE|nr:Serine/threonine-protein kinase haspin [Holothuria leucospilota]
MPLVRTYGKRKARIIQSSVWISPDVDNGHVFSSPDVDLESTELESPPSVEKERSAAVKNQSGNNDTDRQSRKAKPKTFAHIFSCSEEDDKENFVPEDDDTPGIPGPKLLPKKNTVQLQKSSPPLFQINDANITRRRTSSRSLSSSDEKGISLQSGKKRKDRHSVKMSRGLRKMRQDDGALCELGKKSSSSLSSSRSSTTSSSSSWHPPGISSTGSTSSSYDTPPDKSYHLSSITETLSGDSDPDEDILGTSVTPEAKRKKGERKNNCRNKLAQKERKRNCGKLNGKETSTPVSSHCQENGLSPILFDESLPLADDECSIHSDRKSKLHDESDDVFEEVANISRDMNFLNIEQNTDSSFGKISWQNSKIISKKPSRAKSELTKTNLRAKKQTESSMRSQSERKPKTLTIAKADHTTRTTRQSKINAMGAIDQNINASSESDFEIPVENKRKIQPKKTSKKCEKKQSNRSEELSRAAEIVDLVPADSCSNLEKSIKIKDLEKTVKISPCSVLLTKMPCLQTPPRSKQLSRLAACNDSFKDSLTPTRDRKSGLLISAESKVLRQCGQKSPVSFSDALTSAELKQCVKVGEGAYGEVFRTLNARKEAVALKIIPVEGDFSVNDEPQKTFEEILPEIVISRELSSMQTNKVNQTRNFIQVNRVVCVKGCYPDALLHQWDVYNERKGSENERPDMFDEDQLFILFEFADGGKDLEELEFSRIEEAVSILQQVTGSLASAERQYSFEHRDLHWGNILIRKTNRAKSTFMIEGELFEIPSHGVEASIIDFTLSRLQKDGCTVFCDVSDDATLFIGKGDYQFDIYRKMKRENKNDWETFNPHSNVLWLHYILEKLLKNKTYAVDPSKETLRELKTFGRHLLGYSSAEEVLRDSDLLQLLEMK